MNSNKLARRSKFIKRDRMAISVAECAQLLGIGRNSAYEAIHRGEIPAIRIGKRYIVPLAALEDLLGRGPAEDD